MSPHRHSTPQSFEHQKVVIAVGRVDLVDVRVREVVGDLGVAVEAGGLCVRWAALYTAWSCRRRRDGGDVASRRAGGRVGDRSLA